MGLQSIHLSTIACFATVIFVLLIAPKCFPRVPAQSATPQANRGDLPWRMETNLLLRHSQ
jgi:hypothetical protein